MKSIILVLAMFSTPVFAQSYSGDHTLQTIDAGILTLFGDGGLIINSNSGVEIHSGGGGNILLTTPSGNDVDVMSGGNVVMWPNSGYNVYAIDGIQMQQASAQPTCSAPYEGLLIVLPATPGVPGTLQVCLGNGDDTFSWQTK